MNDGVIDKLDDADDDEPLAIQSGADGQSLHASVEREFNPRRPSTQVLS